jgi:flagellar protein FlgJ
MDSLGLTPAALEIINRSGFDSAGLIRKAEQAGETGRDADIRKVAEDFEAIFIRLLLRELRDTVPQSDYFPRSVEQDIYFDMIDTNLADELSKRQALGIGEMIYKEMSGKNEKGLQYDLTISENNRKE